MAKIMRGKTSTKEVATKAYPILEVKSKNISSKKPWFILMAFTMLVGTINTSASNYFTGREQSNTITQIEASVIASTLSKEQIPTEYKSALKKAQSYSDLMHMSKAGLYHQLTSEYGENFSPAAAQYAIEHVDANWKENALKKAQSYQEHMSMSPKAIYKQLISEYGEQFTAEEAQYAIDHLD